MKIKFRFLGICIFFITSVNSILAQLAVQVKTDKQNIIVGDQFQYSIQIKNIQSKQIILPKIKDSIGKFELIKLSKLDTIQNEILQRITLTAWDSGSFYIPKQKIVFKQNNLFDSIFTDSILININTVPVDTAKPIKDIKPNIKVGYAQSEIITFFLIGLLCLLLIGGLIYYFQKKKKEKSKIVIDEDANLLPHELALKRIEKLNNKEFLQQAYYKAYYTELTDIVRHYLDTQFLMQTMESTSDEIVLEAKKMKFSTEVRSTMKSLFDTADLVKFAKILPTPYDNETVLKSALFIINKTKPKEVSKENLKK